MGIIAAAALYLYAQYLGVTLSWLVYLAVYAIAEALTD